MDGGQITYGELVVAAHHRPVLFELVDAALDRVPLPLHLTVERWGTSTSRASSAAVRELIGRDRDRRSDATSTQVGAVGAGTVGLVRPHPHRPGAGPTRSEPRHPDPLEYRGELRTVAVLTGSEQHRQRPAVLLTAQMQLGAPPTARAPESMVVGFGFDAAGRFELQRPAGTGRVLVGAHDGRVDADISHDPAGGVGQRLQRGQDLCPHPARCQRRNSPYTVCQGPYRVGTSRHGAPTRVRQRIPSMSWRFVHTQGRPGLIGRGSSASSTAHCASVRSARPVTATLVTRSPVFGFLLVDKPSTGDPAYSVLTTHLYA